MRRLRRAGPGIGTREAARGGASSSIGRGRQEELEIEPMYTQSALQDDVRRPNATLRSAVARNRTLTEENHRLRSDLRHSREDAAEEKEKVDKLSQTLKRATEVTSENGAAAQEEAKAEIERWKALSTGNSSRLLLL